MVYSTGLTTAGPLLSDPNCRVSGLCVRFRLEGSTMGSGVQCVVLRVKCFGSIAFRSMLPNLGFRVEGSGSGVQGLGFRVWSSGLSVQCLVSRVCVESSGPQPEDSTGTCLNPEAQTRTLNPKPQTPHNPDPHTCKPGTFRVFCSGFRGGRGEA